MDKPHLAILCMSEQKGTIDIARPTPRVIQPRIDSHSVLLTNRDNKDDDEGVTKGIQLFTCRNCPRVRPFQLNAAAHD